MGHRVFHSSSWGRIIETFALAQTFTIEPRPRHWQNFMFVFNPRWDMHSLRAKEIKDSPNSQVVPKILVLLNNGTVWFHNCSGYSYFSNTHLHYYSFAQLASSDALRFPKIQDQGDLKDSLTLQAVLKSLVTDTAVILIFIYAISRGRGVGFFEKLAFVTD